MNAIASVSSNVIPLFASTAPVLMTYAEASVPVCDYAKRLKAEADAQVAEATIKAVRDRRAPWLRLIGGRGETPAVNPYNLIIKDGWNARNVRVRKNIARIDELAVSIAKVGLIKPITVKLEGPDKRMVVVKDGFCRLMAVFRAIEVYGCQIKAVEVHSVSRFNNEADDLVLQLQTGEKLEVLEAGKNFVALTRLKWTPEMIAEAAALSATRVSQILNFMEVVTDEIKDLINSGKVMATFAEQVIREHGYTAAGVAAAEKVLTNAVTVAQSNGKTKATSKDTGKVSLKTALKGIFGSAEVDSEAGQTTVTLTDAEWAEVTKLLRLV